VARGILRAAGTSDELVVDAPPDRHAATDAESTGSPSRGRAGACGEPVNPVSGRTARASASSDIPALDPPPCPLPEREGDSKAIVR
jgi:hypothetical protein